MIKTKKIYIEHLDDGYVVTEEGKRKAFEDSGMLKQHLQYQLNQMVDLLDMGIHDTTIFIEVETNSPKQA